MRNPAVFGAARPFCRLNRPKSSTKPRSTTLRDSFSVRGPMLFPTHGLPPSKDAGNPPTPPALRRRSTRPRPAFEFRFHNPRLIDGATTRAISDPAHPWHILRKRTLCDADERGVLSVRTWSKDAASGGGKPMTCVWRPRKRRVLRAMEEALRRRGYNHEGLRVDGGGEVVPGERSPWDGSLQIRDLEWKAYVSLGDLIEACDGVLNTILAEKKKKAKRAERKEKPDGKLRKGGKEEREEGLGGSS